jgi:hypothetical protein
MSLAFFAQNLTGAVALAEAERPKQGGTALARAQGQRSDAKIIASLAGGKWLTVTEIADAVGLARATAEDRCRNLAIRKQPALVADRRTKPIRYSLFVAPNHKE